MEDVWNDLGTSNNIFGRGYFILGGNALVLIGFIIAATAQSIGALIASNVFLGIGGACQFSYHFFLPGLVPYKYRGDVLGFCYIIATPGNGFGPIISKTLIAKTGPSWRWGYYLCTISTSIVFLLFFFFYHLPTFSILHVGKSKKRQIADLDWGGIVLFMGGVILFILGVNWGGQQYSWTSALVIACTVIGFFTIIGFLVFEAYVPKDPLIPISLLKNKDFMTITIVASVGGMVYYSMTILFPGIVAALFTTDVIYDGWLSMSVTAPSSLGNILTMTTFTLFGKFKPQLIVGVVIMASTTQYTKDRSVIFAVLGVFGVGIFGAGIVKDLYSVAVGFTIPTEDIGLAVGVFSGLRVCAGAIAVAIYGSILSNKDTTLSAQYIPKAAPGAGLPEASLPALFKAVTNGTISAVGAVPGINTVIETAVGTAKKDAYSGAVRLMFLVTITSGIIAIVCSFLVPEIEPLKTDECVRKLNYTSERKNATVAGIEVDTEKPTVTATEVVHA